MIGIYAEEEVKDVFKVEINVGIRIKPNVPGDLERKDPLVIYPGGYHLMALLDLLVVFI